MVPNDRLNDSSSTGTIHTKEEIMESLKYGGSMGKFSSSRTSRTTTPSTPDSHRSGYTLKAHRSTAGPKPPEKQQKVLEEKSIYDKDPDHPYENIDQQPGDLTRIHTIPTHLADPQITTLQL